MKKQGNAHNQIVEILRSWQTTENPMNSVEDILAWVEQKNRTTKVSIEKNPYDYTGFWHYDQEKGEIRNPNGSFFQIRGIRKQWADKVQEQPIMIQNEIGYLGIIAKRFEGMLYFLMQAKIEPGNVNKIQISPTIQATKSNFTQAHGGKAPAYLEFFKDKHKYEILVDQIQSEQSSRFFGKRNRNIILIIDEDVPVLDSHKWMTLGQIKALMKYDNLVNMDTRTVLSCIPFSVNSLSAEDLALARGLFQRESLFQSMFRGSPRENLARIYSYINDYKMYDDSHAEFVDIFAMPDWQLRNGALQSDGGEFKVVFCNIEIEGREVVQWQQPLFEATGESVFGLIYCEEDGKMQFLVRARPEIGCFDKIELGPSVQLAPGETAENHIDRHFLKQLEDGENVDFQGLFSEEGGRFYHEENRNVIMRVQKDSLAPLPDGYFWVDFQTLNLLTQVNNCLNIQLRNLLSVLDL